MLLSGGVMGFYIMGICGNVIVAHSVSVLSAMISGTTHKGAWSASTNNSGWCVSPWSAGDSMPNSEPALCAARTAAAAASVVSLTLTFEVGQSFSLMTLHIRT